MIIKDKKYLQQKSIEINDEHAIKEIITKLEYELIHSEVPGYGLSAIQIGEPVKVSIIRIPQTEKTKELKIDIVNPEIVEMNDPFIFNGEGCLSFPGIYKNTRRYKEIMIKTKDYPTGFVLEGLEAVIAQHELNHFKGVLFFDMVQQPIRTGEKIGRNSPCPICLKGKGIKIKFKKCKEHFGGL